MRARLVIIAVLSLFAAASAFGASATVYLNVSLTVASNCQVTVTDLHFGTYDPLLGNADQPLDATADLNMLCTRGAQATIKFDYGRTPQGLNRGMTFGSDRVNYSLFQDSSRTKPWADGENGLHVVGTGGRTPERYVVYGRVPAGQDVPPGAYNDIVMATVDF
jgi:spore coat protein U domain-containing protein, fimbrial subunit CupE1/2/3/6